MGYRVFNQQFLLTLLNKFNTPCYIYDQQLLMDSLSKASEECKKFFSDHGVIHYAIKANDNEEILKLIKDCGYGVDCVSGGEIKKALKSGYDPSKIVFAGVGKQDWEIQLALENEIYAFNCESLEEIEILNQIAEKSNKIAKIMLRVNPDINAKTHKYISTGMYENKFGIMFEDLVNFLPRLKSLLNIKILGLHYHIGSQIIDLDVFAQLGKTVSTHYQYFSELGINFTDINVGGGLGIDYDTPEINPIPEFKGYFSQLAKTLNFSSNVQIHFELGRSIVAQSGALLTKVLFTKNTAGTNFAIVDAGMNDLMRPALYGVQHKIIALKEYVELSTYSIGGPVCESTDIFAKNLNLPRLNRGDYLVILSSGAYGRVLANQYNCRELISEYLV